MAQRKKLDTAAKLDGAVSDYQIQSAALTEQGFGTIIRCIKLGRIDYANQLSVVVDERLEQFGLTKFAESVKPVLGIPNGSDQYDVGGFVSWVGKIQEEDDAAVDQLLKASATIRSRLS